MYYIYSTFEYTNLNIAFRNTNSIYNQLCDEVPQEI